jgi:DNA-binding beta-propeller fold protein YncE
VLVIDADTSVTMHRIKVGRYPEALAILANGSRAYVINWMSGDISVLNPDTGNELKRLEASDGIRGLALVAAD